MKTNKRPKSRSAPSQAVRPVPRGKAGGAETSFSGSAERGRSLPASAASTRRTDWLLRFSALHLVFLLLLWGAENFIGERNSWMAFLLYLPQQGLIVAPLFFLLLSVWRQLRNRRASTRDAFQTPHKRNSQRALWLFNIAAAALVLFGFLGFNLPLGARNAPQNSLKIRVLTFNTHVGLAGAARIGEVIRREKPDIVCLQEVRGLGVSGDEMQKMREILPHWYFAHHDEVATLSRFPIEETRVHPVKNTWRVILETQIMVRGRLLSVWNTHFITDRAVPKNGARVVRSLGGSAPLRLHQMRQLMNVVPKDAPRVLVMGDFNNPPRGLVYRRLASRWTDAFRAAGTGFGYSYRSDLPLMRIDYIWASRDVRVLAAHVSPHRASDHSAVIADIAIP
jgi:vancomycin resistance protein VanJ